MTALMGDNNPPSMVESIKDVTADVSGWMSEHPVILSEDDAREAKLFLDRASLGLQDMEAERDAQVRPLNEKVKAINTIYRGPRELLETIANELRNRITTFMLKEEETRIAIAEAARRKAEDAERVAREAEEREHSAYGEAHGGVLGVDLVNVTTEADESFKQFERAARAASLAERNAERVRIGGGFRRALSLRDKNTVIVDDPIAAIKDIGPTNETIMEAIVRASRAFKTVFGRWPKGISIKTERKS